MEPIRAGGRGKAWIERAVRFARSVFSRPWVQAASAVFVIALALGAFSGFDLLAQAPAPAAGSSSTPPTASGPGTLGTIAMYVGGLFMYMASGIGQLISSVIDVLIAVVMYNRFSTSAVVSAGWAIIRDTVNMFYVVLLIVIAFGTIVGAGRFDWQKQIPRVLGWAILINFSKTLCGLMIDASQVVTLTFANAIKDIAGGNFVTFLGLLDIMSLSTETVDMQALTGPAASAAAGYQPADFMIGGVMAFLMMSIVLVTLLGLLAIMAFRIVMLWILITVSPLTWFVGSAKDIIKSNAYEDWWNSFKCYLVIGPVLVFFLWLALAVAGAGNIAALEGFNLSTDNTGGIINKVFDMPRLTSFILGLALIFAGFQQASSACAAAVGGSVVKGILGKAQGLSTRIAMAPANLGLGAARGVGSVGRSAAVGVGSRIPLVGAKGIGMRRGELLGKATRTVQGAAKYVPASMGGRALTGVLGKGAAKFEEADKKALGEIAAQKQDTAEAFRSDDAKKAFMQETYEAAKKGEKKWSGANQDIAMAELKKAIEDKDARKKMGEENFAAMMGVYGEDVEKTFSKDDKFKGVWKSFKKERADLFNRVGEDGKKGYKGQKDWNATFKDMDAVRGFDWQSVRDLSDEDRQAIKAALGRADLDTNEYDAAGNKLTALQLLEQKKLGKGVSADVLGSKPPEDITTIIDRSYSTQTGTFANADDLKRLRDALKADPTKLLVDIATRVEAAQGRDVELGRAAISALMGAGKGGVDRSGELIAKVAMNAPDADDARTQLHATAQILQHMPPTKENEKRLKNLLKQARNANMDLAAEANVLPLEDVEMASRLGRTKKAYKDDDTEVKRMVELDNAAFENERQTIENDIEAETRRANAATSDAEKARTAAALADLNKRRDEATKAQMARYAQMDTAAFEAEVRSVDQDIQTQEAAVAAAADDTARQAAAAQAAVLKAKRQQLNRVQAIRTRAERVKDAAANEGEGKKKKGGRS